MPRQFGARKIDEPEQYVAPGNCFLLDPRAMGHSSEEKGPLTEGRSRFRTSGGIAAGKHSSTIAIVGKVSQNAIILSITSFSPG
jgi:hypothetical protein